jgi:cytochrome c553
VRKFLTGAMAALSPIVTGMTVPATAQDSAPPAVTAACEACHGTEGNSQSPMVPRLNGQSADYLAARLNTLLNAANRTPHATNTMRPMVMRLSDEAKQALARHFSRQPPTPATGAVAAPGRVLYQQGVPAQNEPSCQPCHGARGEGSGTAPRLAGQHGEYLKAQLWAFRFGLREHPAMQGKSRKLSSDEIEQLSSYLTGD